jgi:hypothetical protein
VYILLRLALTNIPDSVEVCGTCRSTVYGKAVLQLTCVLEFYNHSVLCVCGGFFFQIFFQLIDDGGGLEPFKKLANF